MANFPYLKKFYSKLLLGIGALVVLFLIAAWLWLRQSLAILVGTITTGELKAPVTIERDTQGVPLIRSENRNSSAFALGFLHAQERFFQMDLLRRNSSGELSELVGSAALSQDKKVRIHQFRKRAERNIAAMPIKQRELLAQYVNGVNFGLNSLAENPWEYLLLGLEPRPWNTADSLLTVYSMYLTLQSAKGRFELRDTALAELLPEDLYAFYFPEGGRWDAPLFGNARAKVSIPKTPISALLDKQDTIAYQPMESDDKIYGSNNWVVGGELTEHGGAILANDMHLGLSVPNIWFRAGWNIPGSNRFMRGVTLPGSPIVVAGSNELVAWGFTNTGGDWSDLIPLELSEDGTQYKTPEGWRNFSIEQEEIAIKGGDSDIMEVRSTIWGPVIDTNYNGTPLAFRWVAHDISGGNMNLLNIETVRSAQEALDLGASLGIPHQNLVVGDKEGNIGWSVAGAIPKRVGFNGSRSLSWADGDVYWDGYLSTQEQPRLYNPPSHRIWSANARIVDSEYLKIIGNHGYALGARQQQIRDRLFAREQFNEQDLLDIQLDNRAVFLERWQQHLLSLLDGQEGYSEIYDQVQNWQGHSSVDSVGYRIVRNYRLKLMELTTAPILTYMRRYQPNFSFGQLKQQFEYPLWEMVQQEPQQLLNPDFESWNAIKLAALDKVLEKMGTSNQPLQQQTWGAQNTARIQHPLGKAVPLLNWFLAMPAEPLPGDTHMPRFQSPSHGASQRLVVAPGRDSDGIFHMPTGQSAHPLSPFYGNGHKDWTEGNASPLVEREPRYRLTLN
ncbi:penicillin acylase family protein [Microbulbifer sp. OS29]|uniref:Penicillin acylase family protein n=1 Tax=Microbulbifer okhotskensis TaxID=2926617 RepID=A0A9X2ELB1_9GAMM|nr:penicillin acylase family protein [Microbulbifer okhotskensis]MCO1334342.1 penicillin acylase family protein [Microbulbifer okhotskensis]